MTEKLPRKEYLDERRELYKYQQAAYDGYEKTLTALAGSFLAFSVGFLGLLRTQDRGFKLAKDTGIFLIGCWVAFAIALGIILAVSFVNARAYTIEIIRLEDALSNKAALQRPNHWSRVSRVLYACSALAFFAGLVLLFLFCKKNFGLL